MARKTARIFIWSLLYFIFAKLGLFLALPPGFATSVWPPSGLALAAVLLYGDSLALSAFFGSMLINLHVGYSHTHEVSYSVALASFGIACGAALQAFLSARLVRRYVQFPNPLDSIPVIGWLTFCGGIFGSLINSTIANLILVGVGFTDPSRLAISWFTWWVGDALGVIVICPTLLIVLAPLNVVSRTRKLSAGSSLVILFTISAMAFFFVRQWEHHRNLQNFKLQAQGIISRFVAKSEVYRSILNAVERLGSEKKGKITQAEFVRFTQKFLKTNPEIQSLSWNPYVEHRDRVAFEKAARAAGRPKYSIRQIGESGKIETASEAPVYYPVACVAPEKGNEGAVGFDTYRTDSIAGSSRREAMDRSAATGEMSAAVRLTLVQDPARRASIIVYNPVSWSGSSMPDGFAVGVFIVPVVIRSLFLPSEKERMNLRIFDFGSTNPSVIFESDALVNDNVIETDRLRFDSVVEFMGRTFKFDMIENRGNYYGRLDWTSWAVLSIGLLANFLVSVLLLLLTGENDRVKKLVDVKTVELDRARLESMRQARLASLGTMASGIAHEINNPLAVITMEVELLGNALPEDKTSAPLHGRIERINKMVFRIANTMMAMKALNQKSASGQFKRVAVSSIVEDTLSICRERFRIGEVELLVDVSETSLVQVMAHPGEISQVLINLLNNAYDAVAEVRGPKWVKLKTSLGEGTVILDVIDGGPGVPSELRERIFEPFFSAKESGGTGLGLSISDAILKNHGGRLMLLAVARDTTFRVELPLAT